jgi:hypothetical protein
MGPLDVAAFRRFEVPAGADRVEAIHVDGVRRVEGVDYRVDERRIVLARPLDPAPPLGVVQKLLIAFCASVVLEGDEVDAIVVSGSDRRSVALGPAGATSPARARRPAVH